MRAGHEQSWKSIHFRRSRASLDSNGPTRRSIVFPPEITWALTVIQQVLPALSRYQIQVLLRELKREGRIVVRGTTKAARWFAKG
jgi:hypothetical protein